MQRKYISIWILVSKIFPDRQAGFREDKEVTNNAYILYHLAEAKFSRTSGRVYALFTDRSAPFDSVNRKNCGKKATSM